jgi:hypothetical protein
MQCYIVWVLKASLNNVRKKKEVGASANAVSERSREFFSSIIHSLLGRSCNSKRVLHWQTETKDGEQTNFLSDLFIDTVTN